MGNGNKDREMETNNKEGQPRPEERVSHIQKLDKKEYVNNGGTDSCKRE